MSPRYAFFCGDAAAVQVEVEAESVAEGILLAEEQTGHTVIAGQRIS